MLYERRNSFYLKYSLYNILFFWIALIAFLNVVDSSIFGNFVNYENNSFIFSDLSLFAGIPYQEALTMYEETASTIAKGFDYLARFPSAFLGEGLLSSTVLNVYVITLPFILSFFVFLFILNALSAEKLLVGSIINSSIITFTFFMSIMSNNSAEAANINLSTTQISAYAFLNSLIFLLVYLIVMSFFEKKRT